MGSNLRNIMQLVGKDNIDDLLKSDTLKLMFVPVLLTKLNKAELVNFTKDEIDALIYDICTT